MTPIKKQKLINDCIRQYVDNKYKIIPNTIRLNINNTINHEVAKMIVAFNLMKQKKEIYTEVRLKGGGIADIFIPEDFAIVEILASETAEQLAEKIKKYPWGLNVDSLNADEVIREVKI